MFRPPIVTADPGIFAPHPSVASVFHDTESVVEAVGGVVYFVLIDVCDRRVAVIPVLQHVTAFATVQELLDCQASGGWLHGLLGILTCPQGRPWRRC